MAESGTGGARTQNLPCTPKGIDTTTKTKRLSNQADLRSNRSQDQLPRKSPGKLKQHLRDAKGCTSERGSEDGILAAAEATKPEEENRPIRRETGDGKSRSINGHQKE